MNEATTPEWFQYLTQNAGEWYQHHTQNAGNHDASRSSSTIEMDYDGPAWPAGVAGYVNEGSQREAYQREVAAVGAGDLREAGAAHQERCDELNRWNGSQSGADTHGDSDADGS